MEKPKIKTIFKGKVQYSDYVLNDRNSHAQISVLLNLHELHSLYFQNWAIDSTYSEPNTCITQNYSVDWAFECYKMKKAILFGRKYVLPVNVSPVLTPQANQMLLLAMIYGNTEIVEYFINNRLISINQSIFGSPKWPSYFILACTCSKAVLDIFKTQKVKYNIGWNSLTAQILTECKGYTLEKTSYMDFVPYNEYALLMKFRNVILINACSPLPLFTLDFACMTKNRGHIKDILEMIPEAGVLSRLSFIVQSEENLFLILSRFDFRTDQNFNGNTPLHYSCYNGDLCAISLLLYLGFPIVQNNENKFPNEIGSAKTKEKASVFFNLCTTEVSSSAKKQKRVFLYSSFQDKMEDLMDILKFNPKDYDKYIGIFRYLKFNKSNKIVTNSRFNIINLITMSKTPVSVEQSIKKMSETRFVPKLYSLEVARKVYFKIFRQVY